MTNRNKVSLHTHFKRLINIKYIICGVNNRAQECINPKDKATSTNCQLPEYDSDNSWLTTNYAQNCSNLLLGQFTLSLVLVTSYAQPKTKN